MKRLKYFNEYSPKEELFYDWRIQAMNVVEPVVIYYCRNEFKGMEYDDVAQELRIHLWNKLNTFDPILSSLRTWADRISRNKLIDLKRAKREFLDSPRRKYLPD